MKSDLDILVLMVTPSHAGGSGAACRLPDLDVVLINRDEVPGRQHFDLAHELFHILTWDAMPPVHVEDATETGGASRVEQLANAFASALLMPARIVQAAADWRTLRGDALIAQLNATADRLEVTATALLWRLVSLDCLPRLGPCGRCRGAAHLYRVCGKPRHARRPCRGRPQVCAGSGERPREAAAVLRRSDLCRSRRAADDRTLHGAACHGCLVIAERAGDGGQVGL
jgi:hypothetical protein